MLFCIFCILSVLHILHILHIYIFCILYRYISRKQPWHIVSPSVLPLLLVFQCDGPAVYVPPSTSIATIMGFITGSSWKIGWFNLRSWGFIYMQNMTDMTVIDPPSTFAYFAYYLTYYLTYYAYGFRGYILFYIYMSKNMTKNSAGSIFVIFCILQYAEYDIIYAEYAK